MINPFAASLPFGAECRCCFSCCVIIIAVAARYYRIISSLRCKIVVVSVVSFLDFLSLRTGTPQLSINTTVEIIAYSMTIP